MSGGLSLVSCCLVPGLGPEDVLVLVVVTDLTEAIITIPEFLVEGHIDELGVEQDVTNHVSVAVVEGGGGARVLGEGGAAELLDPVFLVDFEGFGEAGSSLKIFGETFGWPGHDFCFVFSILKNDVFAKIFFVFLELK